MKHLTRSLLLVVTGLSPLLARAAPSPAEVEGAIARAKAFIYSTQQKNGTWEIVAQGELAPKGRHRGGLTALAAYALVAAGENPQDPRLVRAIDFLKKADMPSAYALGCRAQLWN